MADDVARLFAEYGKVLAADPPRPLPADRERLAAHLPLLERLDAVEGSSVALYDRERGGYAFLTGSFKFLLGYDRTDALAQGPDYFYRQMHPDDLPVVLDTVTRTLRFLHATPPPERKDYRLGFDFRMRSAEGGWIRLLQQILVLEQDRRGAIWLILIVNDRVSEAIAQEGVRRHLRNIRNGKHYLFVEDEAPSPAQTPRLSPREAEILGLVAVGMDSRTIADRLVISVATVNNHRQHILAKMGARNSAEAVRYASELGLLDDDPSS